MKTKNFFYVVIGIAVLLVIFGSWKFLLGFVLAGAIFWYFGETRVKEAVKNAYSKTKDVVDELHDTVIPQNEEKETVVTSSFISPSEINGLYQIIVVAEGKSYILKPSKVSLIPEELTSGQTIIIKTTYCVSGVKPVKKQVIIAINNTYEVV